MGQILHNPFATNRLHGKADNSPSQCVKVGQSALQGHRIDQAGGVPERPIAAKTTKNQGKSNLLKPLYYFFICKKIKPAGTLNRRLSRWGPAGNLRAT